MKDALDPAFLRQLRFIVGSAAGPRVRGHLGRIFSRLKLHPGTWIWKARLNLTGGNIRNIALNAAFLAAAADERNGMTHLLQAARAVRRARTANHRIRNRRLGLSKLAEGVGFEPTVGLTPRSISSRVP